MVAPLNAARCVLAHSAALLPAHAPPAHLPHRLPASLAVMDLERVGLPLLVLCVAAGVTRRWWRPRLQAWWRRRKLRRGGHKQHAGLDRDLDV